MTQVAERASWWRKLRTIYVQDFAAAPATARWIFVLSILFVGARIGLITYLTIYFTNNLGTTIAVVGLAFLVENIMRGVIGPFAGAWSDTWGRNRVVILAALTSALILPTFLWVHSIFALFAWSTLTGLAQGAYGPASTAWLIDLAPEKNRQGILAISYTAVSLGYTVGILLGGVLTQVSYGALALAAFGAFTLVGIIAAVLRAPRAQTENAKKPKVLHNSVQAFSDPAFLFFVACAFAFPFGIGMIVLVFPVYANAIGLTSNEMSLALAVNGALLAILTVPVNSLTQKRGPFSLLPLSALFVATSYIIFAFVHEVVLFAMGVAVFTFGEILFSAAIPSGVALLAPKDMSGAYQGAWGFVFSIGVGASLFIAGSLRDAAGWTTAWAVVAAGTLLAGGALWLGRRVVNRKPATTTA